VAYPDVAGVVDHRTPDIERYRINDGVTLGLIFHGTSGAFIGGFTRRYFRENQLAEPGFTADTPVEGFVDNGDQTFRIYTFVTSGANGQPVGHYGPVPFLVVPSRSRSSTRSGPARRGPPRSVR
jgi:hypothetical protein